MKKWIRSFLVSRKEKETYLFIGVFIILVVFRLWLITGIPKLLVYGSHDDLYFAKMAHYLIHGQWMGPYSQMTLIKGPFYAFFLISSFLTGLPLLFNETVFYIAACLVLFFAFSPMIKNRWWRLLLFTTLLFCPASLATGWTLRVYREFVYFSLTLYVVAFSIGLFLRLDQKITSLLFWSIGLGVSMGAFMITREEGVWVYPILFLLLITCIVFILKKKLDYKVWRSLLILFPILLWYVPSIIITSLNYSSYGFWGTTEQLEPEFNRVLNTLGRIKSSTWYPFIQITKEARMKAYNASPLFNELKDSIETAVVNWQSADDISTNMKPEWYISQYGNGGSEIGAHFLWLFRDVVYTRNAIDHSDSPTYCVKNMVIVLKQGGILYIEGFKNEGVRNNYQGLHHWNCSYEGNDLICSNISGEKINITRELPLKCFFTYGPDDNDWYRIVFKRNSA